MFASLLSAFIDISWVSGLFYGLGIGDLKYMEEITPVYNQAIIEIICKENIKNASPLSGKRVQKWLSREGSGVGGGRGLGVSIKFQG